MSSTRPREEVSSTGGLQGQKGARLHPSLVWVSGRAFGGGSRREREGPGTSKRSTCCKL